MTSRVHRLALVIEPSTRSRVRLAELLAVLSLGTDLGMGQPMEHVMRECLIALRLAERVGLDESERAVAYYVALLAWVGCHVDSYEQAKWFGDEFALKGDFRLVHFTGPVSSMAYMMKHLGAGKPLAERVRLGVAFLGEGRRNAEEMLENHWLAADGFASQLGLGRDVRHGIEQTFERYWDYAQYVTGWTNALLGPLRGNAPPVRMSATPTVIQRASPASWSSICASVWRRIPLTLIHR